VDRHAVDDDEALAEGATALLATTLEAARRLGECNDHLLDPALELLGSRPPPGGGAGPQDARIVHSRGLAPTTLVRATGRAAVRNREQRRALRGVGRLDLRPARQVGKGDVVEQALADDDRSSSLGKRIRA